MPKKKRTRAHKNCMMHPKALWVGVPSINALICSGCVKDKLYIKGIADEARLNNPKAFEEKK